MIPCSILAILAVLTRLWPHVISLIQKRQEIKGDVVMKINIVMRTLWKLGNVNRYPEIM